MKNKLCVGGILFLFIFSAAMISLVKQKNNLRIQGLFIRREVSPFLLNDNVPEIRVINLKGIRETISFAHKRKKSLIFILNRSCVPCEKNIDIGERLYDQVKSNADVIGIIMGEMSKAVALQEALKVRFSLYIPEKRDEFLKRFKVNTSSLTLLIREDGKIEWIKLGDINADDYLNLKNLILK